jgi:hypothetical protein
VIAPASKLELTGGRQAWIDTSANQKKRRGRQSYYVLLVCRRRFQALPPPALQGMSSVLSDRLVVRGDFDNSFSLTTATACRHGAD